MSWGAALGALGGSIAGGLFGSNEASKSRKFQKQAMQNQIRWRVNDMRKAGINPLLAAMSPSGAPAGATGHAADFGNPMHDAMSVKKMAAETELDKQSTAESKSREELQTQQVLESQARAAVHRAEEKLTSAHAISANAQAMKDWSQVAPYQTDTGELSSTWVENLPDVVRGPMRIAIDAVQAIRDASPNKEEWSAVGGAAKKALGIKSPTENYIKEKERTEKEVQKAAKEKEKEAVMEVINKTIDSWNAAHPPAPKKTTRMQDLFGYIKDNLFKKGK